MQMYEYANMHGSPPRPLGERRGAGRVRAGVRVRDRRSRGAPQGAGWDGTGRDEMRWDGAARPRLGTACTEPLAPSPPCQPSPRSQAAVPAFHPLVPPACADLALLCLCRRLPSRSCFCTSDPLLTAFSVQCLQGAFCCFLEKRLPGPCFVSTPGDTSLEKKIIHWRLCLCS